MTQPDYPLMVLPGYEMYQLAHIATYLADGVARHRHATTPADRDQAVQRLAGGSVALTRLDISKDEPLPSVLDVASFHAARGLAGGPRWAEIVELAPLGQPGWAVIGFVPGVGNVGARVANRAVAEALHRHVLTQPAAELATWVLTDRPHVAPAVPPCLDLPAFVTGLDPGSERDRAVARSLCGMDAGLDHVIGQRFAGVDLNVPGVVWPPSPSPPTTGVRRGAAPRLSGHAGAQAATRAPTAPRMSAGP